MPLLAVNLLTVLGIVSFLSCVCVCARAHLKRMNVVPPRRVHYFVILSKHFCGQALLFRFYFSFYRENFSLECPFSICTHVSSVLCLDHKTKDQHTFVKRLNGSQFSVGLHQNYSGWCSHSVVSCVGCLVSCYVGVIYLHFFSVTEEVSTTAKKFLHFSWTCNSFFFL